MQPTFTQVPPRRPSSTTATRAPNPADSRLARVPPEPAPITTRSKSYAMGLRCLTRSHRHPRPTHAEGRPHAGAEVERRPRVRTARLTGADRGRAMGRRHAPGPTRPQPPMAVVGSPKIRRSAWKRSWTPLTYGPLQLFP